MKLFEPGNIGTLSLKNRIVMAAISVGSLAEPDGRLSERLIDYYVARAKGGTGLIITGNARITREIEQPERTLFGRNLMADNEIYIGRFEQLAEAVHDYGAKVAVQLLAGVGRNAPPGMLKFVGAVGPSPNPAFFDRTVTARALAKEEVEHLISSFESAARLLWDAGIDGVEINHHGGYLLDEFTSPLWNRRTDEYGGDLEGRLRFSLRAIDAVKKGAGPNFPLIVKLSLTHRIPGGREIDEGLEIARRFEKAGVDALDIDSGCYDVRYWTNPPTTQPMGCMADLAAMVKKEVSIPVIAVGKLGIPDLAEQALKEGKADFISMARPLLADPEWPQKVEAGRTEDICPCIGDHDGCHKRFSDRKFLSCTVNPACGREKEFAITPAERKKRILVVGGGPAGMEAARVATLRGHRVILWEKGSALGGNLIPAAVPNFKAEYRTLIEYLSGQIKKLRVEIKLNEEATAEKIEAMKPDVLFLATGSKPAIPEIAGIEGKNVVTAVDLLLGKRNTAGKSVVVIGGGIIGCETALFLAEKGGMVNIVEELAGLMRNVYSINRAHVEKLLLDHDVKVFTCTRALEITEQGVRVADKMGVYRTIEADTVVLAAGAKAEDSLWKILKGRVPKVYPIGDCVLPRKAIDAIWEGFRIARII